MGRNIIRPEDRNDPDLERKLEQEHDRRWKKLQSDIESTELDKLYDTIDEKEEARQRGGFEEHCWDELHAEMSDHKGEEEKALKLWREQEKSGRKIG